MPRRYNSFPSGPRKKLATGLFVERGSKPKTPKPVAAAKAEAGYQDGQYTCPPRKNGAPHTSP